MEQFRLLKQYPKSENPVVRVDMRHYQLLRDMHDDSGVSMSQIIAQCIQPTNERQPSICWSFLAGKPRQRSTIPAMWRADFTCRPIGGWI